MGFLLRVLSHLGLLVICTFVVFNSKEQMGFAESGPFADNNVDFCPDMVERGEVNVLRGDVIVYFSFQIGMCMPMCGVIHSE